jgi:selenocysteine lyase/cysteine desulfurase
VRAIDCDFLACSAYKFYGPHIGILYGKRSLIDGVDIPRLDPAPGIGPERFETGTQNHEGIAGTAAAVEFLASIGGRMDGRTRRESLALAFEVLHERGEELFRLMWSGLSAIDGVTLHGPPPGSARTPTVSFTVRGRPSIDVAERLAERGVFVSHGDFYATTVIERLGHANDGVVRAGCCCYTTEAEIDRLVAGVSECARGRLSQPTIISHG